MTQIFISYNRDSEAAATSLSRDLSALGHSPWMDQELSGGQAWWDRILGSIRQCDIFIFVLSQEGLDSTACKREYDYAAELGKPILPVLVADAVSTNLLPPALSRIQFVDYRGQDRDAAFHLARALSTIPPAPPLPDPLPPEPEVPISYLGGLSAQVGSVDALSYEAQSALVMDLRRGLQGPDTGPDARLLLERLRRRRDLYATVAEEIDTLLGGEAAVAVDTATPGAGAPGGGGPGPDRTPPADTATGGDGAGPGADPRLSRSQRLRWARNLALTGLGLTFLATAFFFVVLVQNPMGVVYDTLHFHYFAMALGGAAAGFLAGHRIPVLSGALAGMALGTGIIATTYPHGLLLGVFLVAAPPAGAGLAMLLSRSSGRP